MKKGNRILCLCAALFALIIIGSFIHTSPALAWDTWPAGTHNDPNHVWTVVFDKAMNTATINSQNIYVSNDIQGSSRVGGVNVRASDSKHALVAPPAGGWKSGASYYLIITQKVLTSANRPLKDEVRMPFRIKAITKAVPTVDVLNNGSQMIVKVNGTQLSLKQPPYTVSGHPMVPIKEIAQALGAAVDWDAKNKKMTIMGDKVAELTINSKTARVNGAAVTLETPAAVTAGTIMAPLSFLQPALGAKVSYVNKNNTMNASPQIQLSEIIGQWKGTYFANQGETGLTLTIKGTRYDNLSAIFDFGPIPTNPDLPFGSFEMSGYYNQKTNHLQLNAERWIDQPSGWYMVNIVGKIGQGAFQGSIENKPQYKVNLIKNKYNATEVQLSDIIGQWRGTYFANQGETALTLTIRGDKYEELSAVFDFGPIPANPGVPYGSFEMFGYYNQQSNQLKLNAKRWIEQPSGYSMVNIAGKVNKAGIFQGNLENRPDFKVNLTR